MATYGMVSDADKKSYLNGTAYPRIETKLNLMQEACADHDVKSAEAIGIDIGMTVAFLSDNTQVKPAPRHRSEVATRNACWVRLKP